MLHQKYSSIFNFSFFFSFLLFLDSFPSFFSLILFLDSFSSFFLYHFFSFKKAKRAGMLEFREADGYFRGCFQRFFLDFFLESSWIFIVFICRSLCVVWFEMGKKTDLRRGGETPYLGLFSWMFSHYFLLCLRG